MKTLALLLLLSLCSPVLATEPGTLLTFTGGATWEYTDLQTDLPAIGAAAPVRLNFVVVRPNTPEVCIATRGYVEVAKDTYVPRTYEPLLDGWHIVIPVKPISGEPWAKWGVIKGVQLNGGRVLTADGEIVMPVGENQ